MFTKEITIDGVRCLCKATTKEQLRDDIAAAVLFYDRYEGKQDKLVDHANAFRATTALCYAINNALGEFVLKTPISDKAKTILDEIDFDALTEDAEG